MLLAQDLNSHLYDEQIAVISRNDATLIDTAIAAAEQEAKGYLSRYDIETLFAKEDDERDPTLLMYLKDMATWHFITLANANADMDFRQARYKDALTWLKGIQASKIVPFGWPVTTIENQDTTWLVTSQTRRETNY